MLCVYHLGIVILTVSLVEDRVVVDRFFVSYTFNSIRKMLTTNLHEKSKISPFSVVMCSCVFTSVFSWNVQKILPQNQHEID